jgi:hypothetical protein
MQQHVNGCQSTFDVSHVFEAQASLPPKCLLEIYWSTNLAEWSVMQRCVDQCGSGCGFASEAINYHKCSLEKARGNNIGIGCCC